MRLYRFEATAGGEISAHGSRGAVVTHVVGSDAPWHVVAIHLAPGGVLGAHPAASDQLFLVVAGSGRFCGEEKVLHEAVPGCGAYWHKDELHETRAGVDGLSALVLEGEELGEAIVLPPWE